MGKYCKKKNISKLEFQKSIIEGKKWKRKKIFIIMN